MQVRCRVSVAVIVLFWFANACTEVHPTVLSMRWRFGLLLVFSLWLEFEFYCYCCALA